LDLLGAAKMGHEGRKAQPVAPGPWLDGTPRAFF
jgi:hypothetical protein